MGHIVHKERGLRVTLTARTLVGRAATCAVRLESSVASREHAVLSWDGSCWSVRDLGTRNGTRVGDHILDRAESWSLIEGDEVAFGGKPERWILADAGPPVASAQHNATGAVQLAESGLLVLPGPDRPWVTITEDADGTWVIEVGDEAPRPAIDQEQIESDGGWTLSVPRASLSIPSPTTGTIGDGPKLLRNTRLCFDVSRDGEFVTLSLEHGWRVTSLGSRAHHEALLALARERLRDVEAGLPATEQGWVYVDQLLETLGLDLHHFNVTIFRARQQLAREGVVDVGALVERRSTTRQIRLGTSAIAVRQA